jgi:hypothetical protein
MGCKRCQAAQLPQRLTCGAWQRCAATSCPRRRPHQPWGAPSVLLLLLLAPPHAGHAASAAALRLATASAPAAGAAPWRLDAAAHCLPCVRACVLPAGSCPSRRWLARLQEGRNSARFAGDALAGRSASHLSPGMPAPRPQPASLSLQLLTRGALLHAGNRLCVAPHRDVAGAQLGGPAGGRRGGGRESRMGEIGGACGGSEGHYLRHPLVAPPACCPAR